MIQFQVSLAHTGSASSYLQRVFERMRQERSYSVQETFYGWDVIWKELINTAIYRRGADLSDTGSTWIAAITVREEKTR